MLTFCYWFVIERICRYRSNNYNIGCIWCCLHRYLEHAILKLQRSVRSLEKYIKNSYEQYLLI